MVSISKGNDKIGENVWNVNLMPGETCRKDAPCRHDGCYAMKFPVMFTPVMKAWRENTIEAKIDVKGFFDEINEKLMGARKPPKRFRFHVGGDIPSLEYMKEMIRLTTAWPEIKFLVLTKRYDWAEKMKLYIPSNLTVILSTWPGMDFPVDSTFPKAYIDDESYKMPKMAYLCPGKCEPCGYKCWDLKDNQAVIFKKHR